MSDTTIPKNAIVGCPRCGGSLFLNAGLRILRRRQDLDKTPLGRPDTRNTDWEGHDTVYACGGCLLPVVEDNGEVVSLADHISDEEVAGALLRSGYQIPAARRQETKADGTAEEEGGRD